MNIFSYFRLLRERQPVLLDLIARWDRAKGFGTHSNVLLAITSAVISFITLVTGIIVLCNIKTTLTFAFPLGLAFAFIGVVMMGFAFFFFCRFGDFCTIVNKITGELEPSALCWPLSEFKTEAPIAMNRYLQCFADEISEAERQEGASSTSRKKWEDFAELHLDLYELITGIHDQSRFRR